MLYEGSSRGLSVALPAFLDYMRKKEAKYQLDLTRSPLCKMIRLFTQDHSLAVLAVYNIWTSSQAKVGDLADKIESMGITKEQFIEVVIENDLDSSQSAKFFTKAV